ncbi:hypothetical protein EIP91_009522 [Steccherinum ochraceum]|uniref:F-box domain-containing protein n=1 Tax=Steccherinum ochraceum TaxID=92696 RepID=A0A4V6N707_9APHY|nr:hypothetical protein EIP91_009522 [Steccherinum ochraceum]
MAHSTDSLGSDDLIAFTVDPENSDVEGELTLAVASTAFSVERSATRRLRVVTRSALAEVDDIAPVSAVLLPEELWSAIVETFSDDRTTLLSISTVSKPLCRIAQRLLFWSLVASELNCPQDAGAFADFLEAHPHLAGVVRALSLSDHAYRHRPSVLDFMEWSSDGMTGGLDFDDLTRIPANLPRLKKLYISDHHLASTLTGRRRCGPTRFSAAVRDASKESLESPQLASRDLNSWSFFLASASPFGRQKHFCTAKVFSGWQASMTAPATSTWQPKDGGPAVPVAVLNGLTEGEARADGEDSSWATARSKAAGRRRRHTTPCSYRPSFWLSRSNLNGSRSLDRGKG